MKELIANGSSSFMLCCVRWPDMAVIKTEVDFITLHMHPEYFTF